MANVERNPTDEKDILEKISKVLGVNGDKKQDYETVKTMTKKWVNRLLWFSCLWITLSYILAFMNKEQVATDLSIQVVTIIIGTFIPYVIRGFFDTYCMKKQEYKNKLLELDKEYKSNESNTNTLG